MFIVGSHLYLMLWELHCQSEVMSFILELEVKEIYHIKKLVVLRDDF